MLSTLLLSAGWIQSASPGTRETQRSIDISAGPLQGALAEFSRQSGLQILFQAEAVRGVSAAAVIGSITPTAALSALLGDTGLTFEFVNSRTVAIRSVAKSETGRVQLYLSFAQDIEPPCAEAASARQTAAALARLAIPEVLIHGTSSRNVDIERTQDDVQPYVVLSRESVEGSRANNVEEYANLLRLRSLHATDASRAVSIRGVVASGEPLILVNGRRVSDRGSWSYGLHDLNGIPPAAVDRIEILPSTAPRGGVATGGVVNFVLAKDYRPGVPMPELYATTGASAFRVSIGLTGHRIAGNEPQYTFEHDLGSLLMPGGPRGPWPSHLSAILGFVDALCAQARRAVASRFSRTRRAPARKLRSSHSAYPRPVSRHSTPSTRLII
jgi:hypothetical protein